MNVYSILLLIQKQFPYLCEMRYPFNNRIWLYI